MVRTPVLFSASSCLRFGNDSPPGGSSIPPQAIQSLRDTLGQHTVLNHKRESASSRKKPFLSLRNLGLSLTLLAGSLGLTGYGVNRVQHAVNTIPRGEAAAVEAQMNAYQKGVGKQFDKFNQWTQRVQKDSVSYHYDTHALQGFQEQAETLAKSLATLLAQSDNPQDRAVAEKMLFETNRNDTVIDQIGIDLFTHVRERIRAKEPLAIATFVEAHPELAHLPPKAQEHLATEIFTLFNQHPTMEMQQFKKEFVEQNRAETRQHSQHRPTPQRLLRDVLEVHIGHRLSGVNLERFSSLDTQAKALDFMKAAMHNPNNFQQLSEAEREYVVERSEDILQVLDYDFQHPGLLSLLLTGLILTAGVTASGLGIRQTSQQVSQAFRQRLEERRNYLQSQFVIEDYRAEAFPEVHKTLKEHASTLIEARNRAVLEPGNADLYALYTELYGANQKQWPTAAKLAGFYKNMAQATLLKNQKRSRVTNETFHKALERVLRQSQQQQTYFPEFELASLLNELYPSASVVNPTTGEPLRPYHQEIQKLDDSLIALQVKVLNERVVLTKLQQDQAEQQQKLENLPSQATTERALEKQKLESLTSSLKLHQELIAEYQRHYPPLAQQRIKYELLGMSESDTEAMAAKLKELEALRKHYEGLTQDSQVDRLWEQVQVRQGMVNATQEELHQERTVRDKAGRVLRDVEQQKRPPSDPSAKNA